MSGRGKFRLGDFFYQETGRMPSGGRRLRVWGSDGKTEFGTIGRRGQDRGGYATWLPDGKRLPLWPVPGSQAEAAGALREFVEAAAENAGGPAHL